MSTVTNSLNKVFFRQSATPEHTIASQDTGVVYYGSIVDGVLLIDDSGDGSLLEGPLATLVPYMDGDRVAFVLRNRRPLILSVEGGFGASDEYAGLASIGEQNAEGVSTVQQLADEAKARADAAQEAFDEFVPGVNQELSDLQQQAEDAAAAQTILQAALDAGLMRPAKASNPPTPGKGLIWLVVDELTGTKGVGLRVANSAGTGWMSYQILAEDVLVIGPDGLVRLKNGVVTAEALAAKLALVTRLIAGPEDGYHTEMSQTGIKFRSKIAGVTNPVETLRINTPGTDSEGDVFSLVDPTDLSSTVASINVAGQAGFSDVSVENTASMESLVLAGETPDVWVPRFAPHIIAATRFSNEDWGVSYSGSRFINNVGWKRVCEFEWVNDTGMDRIVWLPSTSFTIRTTAAATTGLAWGWSLDGSAPTANTPATNTYLTPSAIGYQALSSTEQHVTVPAGATLKARLDVYNGGFEWVFQATNWVSIWDRGPANMGEPGDAKPSDLTVVGGANTSNTEGATQKTYVKTVDHSWLRTFYRDSGSYNSGQVSRATQGSWTGAAAQAQKGAFGFPDLTGLLSGATILKIEVYVYFQHWWNNSGGVARIGVHNALSAPSTLSGGSSLVNVATTKPGGAWVTLPASTHAGFKSGATRGILLYTTSNAVADYGWASAAKLRVTYKK